MTRDNAVYCTQGPEHLDALKAGPLSGKSFVFKDLFDVEGFATGAGNPKWLETHEVATSTSPLILSLLEAGAECQGRVQTDELAYSLMVTIFITAPQKIQPHPSACRVALPVAVQSRWQMVMWTFLSALTPVALCAFQPAIVVYSA